MTGAPPPRGFPRDNSLSHVFGGLLLATLAGQALWGVAGYNAQARTAGLQEVSLWRYVTSSGFAFLCASIFFFTSGLSRKTSGFSLVSVFSFWSMAICVWV